MMLDRIGFLIKHWTLIKNKNSGLFGLGRTLGA